MRLLGFARPIQKYAIPYFFYSLLYALFNSLTFLLIMPILKTMFDADYTFVYVEKLPPLAFNQEYLTALFNYTYSHLFNEYNPENVLLMLAVVTIFVSLLSNLFRYLGSWTVENMRTRTLQRMRNEMFSKGPIKYVGKEIRAVIMSLLGVDSQDTICLVDAESIAIEAAFVASDGAIICVENDKGAKDTMEDNVKQFGVHNVQIIPDLSEGSMAKIPIPRLSFIVANKHLEEDIQRLLKKNPKMQFVIYTLELNILSGIKPLFDKYGISNMEVLQINVAKTNKDSMFVNQPAPWLITGEVL